MYTEAVHPKSVQEKALADTTAQFLSKNLRSKPTLEEVCRHVGCNEFKLKKVFKTHYRYGIFTYYTILRMEQAKELMENTDYPLAKIARKIGYTHSSFSTAFKRMFKKSPEEWKIEAKLFGKEEMLPFTKTDAAKLQ